MKKIAVTGGSKMDRCIIVQAISLLTNFPIIRPASFSNTAIKYGLKNNLEECNFYDLFTYVLASYTERIEIEQYYDFYISDGCVLSEVALMEAYCKKSSANKKGKEEMLNMAQSIKKIALEYVLSKYDLIIHIRKETEDTLDVNLLLESYYKNHQISSILYDECYLLDIIKRIAERIDIKNSISPESAFNKARMII